MGAVLNWYHSESKKAVKGHCGSKGRKDRLRGCKKRDGSKKNLTANPTNTPTVEPTNSPTTAPSPVPTITPTNAPTECVDNWTTCAQNVNSCLSSKQVKLNCKVTCDLCDKPP